MKLATSQKGLAGNRSIRATTDLDRAEIRFLEYRLEVAAAWPDSKRKLATLEAILARLGSPRPAQ